MEHRDGLTELERELLELASGAPNVGVTTTGLDEELLEVSPGRPVLEHVLHDLASRGLVRTERAPSMTTASDDPSAVGEVSRDDWWIVTRMGREAIGLPPGRVRSPRPSPPLIMRYLERGMKLCLGWFVRRRRENSH